MLPIALGLSVLGLTLQQDNYFEKLGPVNPNKTKETIDDIDNYTIGLLRNQYTGRNNNFVSENSHIVRPRYGKRDPYTSGKEWQKYHKLQNKAMKDLYTFDHLVDNTRILRASNDCKVRIPVILDRNHKGWDSVPNVAYEYDDLQKSGVYYFDVDHNHYDDTVGTADANQHFDEYFWLPEEYFGNPWGPNGQLYNTDLRTKSSKPSAYGPPPDKLKNNKKVRFHGVPTIF